MIERQLRGRQCASETASNTPIQLLEFEELRQAFAHAVNNLPPRRREVFVLARFHGLTYREIAATLHIAPQTVANQMTAAIATLQGALSPFNDVAVGSQA